MKNKIKSVLNTRTKKAAAVAGIVVIIIAAAFAVMASYYAKRWYPNSEVNGIALAGMTLEESMQAVQEGLDNYQLQILGRDDGELKFTGKDIELGADYEEELKALFEDVHNESFLSYLFNAFAQEMEFSVFFSEEKLDAVISESALVKGTAEYHIVEPVSAYVEYSEEQKCYVIVPDIAGNTLHIEAFNNAVREAVKAMDTIIDCTDAERYQGIYMEPEFKAEGETITGLYNQMNGYLFRWFVWDMGEGVTETLEPDTILNWLDINEEAHEVVLDEESLSKWIEEMCVKYKTVGGPRQFTTHSGKTIEVKDGDYGWRIDYEAERDRVLEIFHGDINTETVNQYMEERSDDTKKSLVMELEPEYSHTAFKKNYDNMFEDWDTQNYSEVDLTAQMVYIYKDGKLAFSAKCVSGLPSDSSRATQTGVWFVKEKKEEKVLTGDDYRVESKFWVRITWSGTGYHWSNRNWSNWSPELYKTKGSHGCINLQLEDAKTVYGLVNFNDVVFIHY